MITPMPACVTAVDEVHEIVRRAEARARRVISDDLVTPGSVERMLGHAHQFDVRVALLPHVRDQFVGEFAPVQEWRRAAVVTTPAARMHFIDVDRLLVRARVLPRAAATRHRAIRVRRVPRRSNRCPAAAPSGNRTGPTSAACGPAACESRTCIQRPGPTSGMNSSHMTGAAARLHRVLATVPEVERTDDADPLGIRRPDRKAGARQAVHESPGARRACSTASSDCPRRTDRDRSRRVAARSNTRRAWWPSAPLRYLTCNVYGCSGRRYGTRPSNKPAGCSGSSSNPSPVSPSQCT